MITTHHLAVQKTARYCVLGDISPDSSELWVVCHGFGQLARAFVSAFEPIAEKGRLIVAPEGLSRFYKSQGTVHTSETPVGATWMTSEDRENEIRDYIGYLDILLGSLLPRMASSVQVTALGFSQGAATVSRWVAASSPKLRQLILWGGLLPPEFKEPGALGGLKSQRMSLVIGNSDRYFRPDMVESEVNRLKGLEMPVSLVRFEGGHVIDPDALKGLAV